MVAPILVVRASRTKLVFVLLASIGFVGLGIFLVVAKDGSAVWAGWLNIVFFGTGIPLFLIQLADTRARVILSDSGVFDRTLGVGVVPWSDIADAYIKLVHGNHFVCLVLRDEKKWIGKLSSTQQVLVRINEKLGAQPLNINLASTVVDPLLVLDIVLKKSMEHRDDVRM